MNQMNIRENILENRKRLNFTQQNLAEFLNISKAAVSKWEQGHSVPDIQYISEMAVLFDISVDELIGFSPELSKEQIKTIFHSLSASFSCENYDDVLQEVKRYGKRYYNCYPFLTTLINLLVNHVNLAETPEETLELTETLIDRVMTHTDSAKLKEQMMFYRAAMLITHGQPGEVIPLLKDYTEPRMPINSVLAQSYLMTGVPGKAKEVLQAEVYEAVVFIMSDMTMMMYSDLYNDLEAVMERGTALDEAFKLKSLHPSSTLNFYLVAAMKMSGDKERCLFYLNEFLECVKHLADAYYLHGDEFFSDIDDWLNNLDIGNNAPVSLMNAKKQLIHSVTDNEVFRDYKEDIAFKNIVHTLKTTLEEK